MKYLRLAYRATTLFLQNKIVSKEEVINSYDQVSKNYEKYFLSTMHIYNNIAIDEYLKDIIESENLNILDLACGTGYNSMYLNKFITNSTFSLVDGSSKMIELAKDNNNLNAVFEVSDMLSYLEQQTPSTFDCIICTWALKYQNISKLLQHSKRVLKDDGYFICILNTKDSLKEFYSVYYDVLAAQAKIDKVMLKLANPKNLASFEKTFKKAGFKAIFSSKYAHDFTFENSSDLTDFITKTGALAGFDKMIDITNKDIKQTIARSVEKRLLKTITHRFVVGVFKKEQMYE